MENVELWKKYWENPTEENFSKLFRAYKSFIKPAVSRYNKRYEQEVEAAAYIGLWDAIKTRTPDIKHFFNYALTCMYRAINRDGLKWLNAKKQATFMTVSLGDSYNPSYTYEPSFIEQDHARTILTKLFENEKPIDLEIAMYVYGNGYSWQEAFDKFQLGKSPGGLRKRISKVFKRLRGGA